MLNILRHLLLRRCLQAGIVALLVSTVCFFLMHSLSGDLAFRIAAGRYGYDMVTTAAAEAVRAELGLDRPLLQGLLFWWQQLLQFDLGDSYLTSAPVIEEIREQFGHTLQLAISALALSIVIALPVGLIAGLNPHGWLDRVSLALSVVLRAFPPFLLGILLILLLSSKLGITNAANASHEHGGLLLPALTLALGLAAVSSRVARDAMVEVRRSAYFNFARTKGLSDLLALLRHGVRNAAVPVIAYLGVQLVFLMEGVIIIESLFAWPGIGHALAHAVFGRDIPMIQGTAIVMGLLFVLCNTLVDIACLVADPRQRYLATRRADT
ncbi:ABC transporter permease [Methylobacillus flagellatus]|uniref:Binding-protein-dependent transport systems inner membrane component n=1 Tax=Methylobacillus flagellatus (strain ATCC 51484 / DSM 6875 / VKM B-1610 / KT) TaxID=265072 RepID=Q1GYN3_METFK|nr:ABC transporter permease [Methylobacillus flagellatus]ABE50654.1 binding-protein-dependent transport systems inner membrane component [Methylobacillus flagellatus KT]